jgi:riboflavin transporter FmnP
MNIIGAIVAGLAGTIVISLLMAMGPRMGMPKMAIWEMLGTMFSPQGNVGLGWVMHFMMGVIFAIIYAALWAAGIGSATLLSGVIFGVVHFLVAGLMMGGMPMLHAGIKAGTVQAPGVLMLNSGVMGFMGGLIGHVVYGLVVALVYGAFIR